MYYEACIVVGDFINVCLYVVVVVEGNVGEG